MRHLFLLKNYTQNHLDDAQIFLIYQKLYLSVQICVLFDRMFHLHLHPTSWMLL